MTKYYKLNSMTEIAQLIKIKDKPLPYLQLANLIKTTFTNLDEQDLTGLVEAFLDKSKKQFSVEESLCIVQSIKRQVQRLQPRMYELSTFYFNSIITRRQDKLVKINLDIPSEIDVNKDFKDILDQDFYRKLINYGSTGLLFIKFEEKSHKRYKFFQWVQNNLDFFMNEDPNCNLYSTLVKQVWSFKFYQSLQTIDKIRIAYPNDYEVSSVEVGLRLFAEMMSEIVQNEELKQVFIDRKQFEIKFENDHNNKLQQKDFNMKINQVKQLLLFGSNYFMTIKNQFKNQYYMAISIFLGNRQDNYAKENDEIIRLKEISITDRFFYAKMFFRNEDFQNLKMQLLENYLSVSNLDYILLYGTRKQSQQILQNYIDQTNQLQKVAIISVFLKIFLQQGKFGLRQNKMAYYNKFIKYYEFILVSIDSGISKHKFDQKCITVQVQRKKKTLNKTFSFNCTNCKSSQCLLSITKRIANDAKQHQVRMKGNNTFSKDQRNQVMHCLDCMQLLPKCAVCLYPITVYNGYAEESKKNSSTQKHVNSGESLENSLVWCPKCFHGGHFNHIMKWLQLSQKKCPVYSCKCKCSI